MRLEDLRPKASIHGILPDSLVTVVAADWHGSDALELTYKTADGRIDSELLYRYDEARLSVAEAGRPWSFEQSGFAKGEFGLAETLSQAKVTSVGGMVQEGILVT